MYDFAAMSPRDKTRAIHRLRAARGRLQDGWTKGAYHRIINGKHHYCLVGAIEYGESNGAYGPARLALESVLPDAHLTRWNDSQQDKRAVIRAVDRALKALGATP